MTQKKRKMFLVYSEHTGRVIDFVPANVTCFRYPCPDGEETTWTAKEHWPEVCDVRGWNP